MKLNPFSPKIKKLKEADADTYDVVVIGSGSGMITVEMALDAGFKTALIDKGPAGGTCLNVGCIPSKMLVAVADRIMEVREAERFGIDASISGIDFNKIMADMQQAVAPENKSIHEYFESQKEFDYFEGACRFIGERAIEINGRIIKGEKIFIASGARPFIPVINGLSEGDYLTNETVLALSDLPKHLAIIGGGYIGVEYGHFFSALGSDVTLIQNQPRLIPNEEPEISELLYGELQKRMKIHLNATVRNVQKKGTGYLLKVADNQSNNETNVSASHLLLAAGRQSNADLLEVKNAGIETNAKGFIIINEYLETSQKGIWAFGDANGRQMFRHIANAEAQTAWRNAVKEQKEKFRYDIAPRAIFTYPQIASVGMTEADAALSHEIYVGKAPYDSTTMGMALREDKGFSKVIVDKENMNILGFHLIGPNASILIQEVVNVMALGGQISMVLAGIHIHPAMTELIVRTFANLAETVTSAER